MCLYLVLVIASAPYCRAPGLVAVSKFSSLKLGHVPITAIYFNLYKMAQNDLQY